MIENQYGRPGITGPATPGHADGAFLARVADQHVLLKNPTGVTGVCNTIHPMAGDPATDMPGIPMLRSLVQRDGASTWTWTDPSGLMPMWAIRMISEIVCPDPDLRVLPDPQAPGKGILYRRVLPDHTVERAPSRWAPIGPVRIAYGGSKAKDDQLDGDDGWVKDSLLLAGQTIRRGCSFVCTDGEIRFEHDPVSGAWTRTETRSGVTRSWTGAKDLECREPDFRTATLRETTPNRVDEPMTYTVETGCTCEQAATLANEAGWILDQWTGQDTDSTLNLQRSLAAPFLRSHPECAYVYQGPGGTGKSTLAKDLMEHLGDQATTMSLDLLAQPTAMSAENKMGDLMSHLLALSDDYDPTHGRFEKSLPNLKTLLTGLLPFSARRQGENSVDGMPQSTHLITTNYHLPVSSSEAEQRRFAFSTIASQTTRARHYLPFRRKHGFWPFMLVGAITWLTIGDRQCRSVAFVDLESLSDMEVAAIRSVLDTGVVIPDPGMRVNWKNIGLVRTSTRIGSEDGRPHTAYRPAPEGDGLRGRRVRHARRRARDPARPRPGSQGHGPGRVGGHDPGGGSADLPLPCGQEPVQRRAPPFVEGRVPGSAGGHVAPDRPVEADLRDDRRRRLHVGGPRLPQAGSDVRLGADPDGRRPVRDAAPAAHVRGAHPVRRRPPPLPHP